MTTYISRRRWRPILGALLAVGLSIGMLGSVAREARADTLQSSCTNTTYVDGTNATQKKKNFGASIDLVIQSDTTKFALLECAVTGIPAGATGVSASMNVWCRSVCTSHTARLHDQPATWTEGTQNGANGSVNWNDLHTYGTQLSTVTVGASAWAVLPASTVTGNGTFRFALATTSATNQTYGSDDAGVGLKPYLSITYTPAATTTTAPPPTTTTVPPGTTLNINPVVDCGINPETIAAETPIGVNVTTSDTWVINPNIRNCQTGIMVQKNAAGAVPQRVKIIASPDYAGYTTTLLFHNRAAIRIKRGIDIEIGDTGAPASQIGGNLKFEANYKHLEVNGDQRTHVHHVTSTGGSGCPTPGSPSPATPIFVPQTDKCGAIWGFKWLADRTFGAPQESLDSRIDHSIIDGYFEEGISTDSRGNTAAQRSGAAFGTVTAKGTGTLTLSGVGTTENYVDQFIIDNDGTGKGATFKILSRSTNTFTVDDPENRLSQVAVNDRVTLGMRFYHFRADDNQVEAQNVKNAISFHGSTLYSRIDSNTVTGVPSYIYPTTFNHRAVAQCLKNHSTAGPDVPMFNFYNSVVDNICSDGDISVTVVSFGTYEVDSPTWLSGNTLGASYQETRYLSSQPASDPTLFLE